MDTDTKKNLEQGSKRKKSVKHGGGCAAMGNTRCDDCSARP